MDILSIGQMAKLNCVSEKALRIYHKEEILVPRYVDEKTGYRYYSLQQSATLDMILQLKEMGLPLSGIKEILDKHDISFLQSVIQEQAKSIEEELHRLNTARQMAQHMLHQCNFMQAKPNMGQIQIENLPARRILRFEVHCFSVMKAVNPAITALESWEHNLRIVKRKMLDMGLPLTLFRNVGCVVSKENLCALNITFGDAFIFLNNDICSEGAECVPGGEFVSLYCDGMISSDGEYMEERNILRLMEYISEHNLEVTGDYLGEVLADTPAFHYTGRDMLLKLQIPVRKTKCG